MKNFLLSLPVGSSVSDYSAVELSHPKGRKVSFLSKGDEFFELHHFEPKRGAASCFVEEDGNTTSKSWWNFFLDFFWIFWKKFWENFIFFSKHIFSRILWTSKSGQVRCYFSACSRPRKTRNKRKSFPGWPWPSSHLTYCSDEVNIRINISPWYIRNRKKIVTSKFPFLARQTKKSWRKLLTQKRLTMNFIFGWIATNCSTR